MLDKLMCIITVSLRKSSLQIINTKMHTKTACLSNVVVQYFDRKILQFY